MFFANLSQIRSAGGGGKGGGLGWADERIALHLAHIFDV